MTRTDIGSWQAMARSALAPTSENPGLETVLLLAHVLHRPKEWLLAHPEAVLTPEQQEQLSTLLARLANGEPLPYITGRQEFFGLSFIVSPDVLIPRPETELLVERAIDWLRAHPNSTRVADIGTGSGCIAVSLAASLPGIRVDAVDRSFAALRIAGQNAAEHHVSRRVRLVQADLLSAFHGPYDLICANLPYIPSSTLAGLPVARHEPLQALDGGEDGLVFIRRLLEDIRRVTRPGSLILLEIENRQAASVTALVEHVFPHAIVQVHPDLAGHDRLVEAEIQVEP